MKKSIILAATILAGFSLAGCGNHYSNSKSEYKINIHLKTNERSSSAKTNKNLASRVVNNSTSSAAKSSVSSNHQSTPNDVSKDTDQGVDDGSGYAGCNYQDDGADASENYDYSYYNKEESSSSVSSSNPKSSSNDNERTYTTTTNQPQGTVDQNQQQ